MGFFSVICYLVVDAGDDGEAERIANAALGEVCDARIDPRIVAAEPVETIGPFPSEEEAEKAAQEAIQ